MLAFLDLEGDQETLALGIVFGERRHDLHIGEAVLQIEATNQVAIGLDPVRIVDVGAAKKAQQIRFAGLDDVLQAVRRVGVLPTKSIDFTPVFCPSAMVKTRSTRLLGCSMIWA